MKDTDWAVVGARDPFAGLLVWVVQATQKNLHFLMIARSLRRSIGWHLLAAGPALTDGITMLSL